MKTYMASAETVKHKWRLVDATGLTLGRLASEIAMHLRGKRKPEFTPHADTGDFVVVINVEKLKVTGNKLQDKKYYHYSGYPSGMREETLGKLLNRKPQDALFHAVKGMLPKGPLGRQIMTKLKVYAGAEHPHAAQKPKQIEGIQ